MGIFKIPLGPTFNCVNGIQLFRLTLPVKTLLNMGLKQISPTKPSFLALCLPVSKQCQIIWWNFLNAAARQMRPVSQTGVDAVQEACPVQCFVLVRVQRDATTLLRSPKLLTTQMTWIVMMMILIIFLIHEERMHRWHICLWQNNSELSWNFDV